MLLPTALPNNSKQKRILTALLYEVQRLYPESSDQVAVNRFILYTIELEKRFSIELKGIFTRSELSLIIDAENGTMINTQYWGSQQMMAIHLNDAHNLDGLGTKWGVDIDHLIEKIEEMPKSLFLFFHEQVYRFWNEGENSLEEFLEKYAA